MAQMAENGTYKPGCSLSHPRSCPGCGQLACSLAPQASHGHASRTMSTSPHMCRTPAPPSMYMQQDDVVIRVRQLPHDMVVVDLRSRSRVGQGDMGANAGRILAFQGHLQQLLAKQHLVRL